MDLFVSLKQTTTTPLRDLYWGLYLFLEREGLSPRAQNVSIGLTLAGSKVDLVPGRRQSAYGDDHSLYRRKADTWTQTNVQTHIRLIQNCGRRDEIRAVKLWRDRHGLDFPSFYLELTVIEALAGARHFQPAANVLRVLRYLSEDFPNARVVDPANTNNIISADLTAAEKSAIASRARDSARRPTWPEILW